MQKTAKFAAVASVLALSLAACGQRTDTSGSGGGESAAPTQTVESTKIAGADKFKACMVSDSGGFDDKSFNQTSYKGLTDAQAAYGIQTGKVESQSSSQYQGNVDKMVQAGCNIVVTVGFNLGDVTEKAAKANSTTDFAIVDYGYENPPGNLKALSFDTAEPSFMAGYLAAGMSKTGVVGTFGGMKIPTVTIFMDGYWEGVQYYNKQNNANVKVVGWDEKSQNGSFTNNFDDKNKGQSTAESLISQGADVIFPVAGPAGLGGLKAAQDGDKMAIWVDTDGCESAAEYCDTLLTSVEKGMDVAVQTAIKDSLQKKFDSKPYVGTLANGGVGLAPYHEWDSKIPADLKSQVDQVQQDLESGKITITSPAALN